MTTTSGPGTEVLGEVIVQPGVPGPVTTLPRTGAPINTTLLLGAIAVTLGALTITFGKTKAPRKR